MSPHVDPSEARWRKSSWSGSTDSDCVEVAPISGLIALRDSKAPGSGVLFMNPAAWRAVLRCVGDRTSS
ncbi:DUF397 domain-containing protein [Spirillospora sp. NPDC049652]